MGYSNNLLVSESYWWQNPYSIMSKYCLILFVCIYLLFVCRAFLKPVVTKSSQPVL